MLFICLTPHYRVLSIANPSTEIVAGPLSPHIINFCHSNSILYTSVWTLSLTPYPSDWSPDWDFSKFNHVYFVLQDWRQSSSSLTLTGPSITENQTWPGSSPLSLRPGPGDGVAAAVSIYRQLEFPVIIIDNFSPNIPTWSSLPCPSWHIQSRQLIIKWRFSLVLQLSYPECQPLPIWAVRN